VDTKEDNLFELIVSIIREPVYLYPIIPGKEIAGGLTEAEHMLRDNPDQQAAWLQPGTGMEEPLIFQTAVLLIMVIGWIHIQAVVTATRGYQAEVTVVEDAGGGGYGGIVGNGCSGNKQLVNGRAGCFRPAFMQFHAKRIQSQPVSQGHQGCALTGAWVQDTAAVGGGDVSENQVGYGRRQGEIASFFRIR
jgi:hypothetical protein